MLDKQEYPQEISEPSFQDSLIWKKKTLTIDEAVEYTGIGQAKFRSLLRQRGCPFALWIGTTVYIIRTELERYINTHKHI